MSDLEISIQDEVNAIKMNRPHVVILGAGASRAAFPKGDINGRKLPLMNDFVSVLELTELLKGWGIDPRNNFEEIFSHLCDKKETEKIDQLTTIIEHYFKDLTICDEPTIYDHLILSLRKQDIIATFNWDPLLLQAYIRNSKAGLTLPHLFYLHGNIAVGYCTTDKITGIRGNKCTKCRKLFTSTPLLYPITKKDYATDPFIANEWKGLKWGLKNAFMITVFGYSAPKTDQEARKAMKEAWGNVDDRNMEQTAFISIQSEDEISENWDEFIHTHHFEVDADFYDSWIATHPRRTGEAYINQYIEAQFIDKNPIPKELPLPKLWEWFRQFKPAEEKDNYHL